MLFKCIPATQTPARSSPKKSTMGGTGCDAQMKIAEFIGAQLFKRGNFRVRPVAVKLLARVRNGPADARWSTSVLSPTIVPPVATETS